MCCVRHQASTFVPQSQSGEEPAASVRICDAASSDRGGVQHRDRAPSLSDADEDSPAACLCVLLYDASSLGDAGRIEEVRGSC